MSRLRAILLRDGQRLATLLNLFLMLRGYDLRGFANQVRRFEKDVRGWLAELALARLKSSPPKPAPQIKYTPRAPRTAPIKRALPPEPKPPVFRLPLPKNARPETKSSAPARIRAPARPFVPQRHLIAFARRLDAAAHVLNHPEAALARLISRWRRQAADPACTARVHARARQFCWQMFQRRAPELFKARPSTDDRQPGPPPDE